MGLFSRLFCGLGAALLAVPALAHEFWIEPLSTQVAPGAPLVADLRVGDDLAGAKHAYIPRNFRRFDLALDDQILPVPGRIGDRPALNMQVAGEGLAVALHVTRDHQITYRDFDKFTRFCTRKGFADVVDQHVARGFETSEVRERYSRYAKALVGVGAGDGADRAFGLEVELVALANPYRDDLSAGMPVQLLYQGAPLPDAQIELFERAPDLTVRLQTLRTDAAGQVRLPVVPGHFYLVDHVVMRALDPETENGMQWESLWASLTFGVAE
jgi:hypothetical protein